MNPSLRVLLRLHSGFGLGDVVSFTVVLKHLRKYRPDWQVSCISARGAHSALNGLCHRSLAEGDTENTYDSVVNVDLWNEDFGVHNGRPCGKIEWLLLRTFGIEPDPELMFYEVRLPQLAVTNAKIFIKSGLAFSDTPAASKIVIIHAAGHSYKEKKDLHSSEVAGILFAVTDQGRYPVVLDRPIGAELVTAVISQARAFVGIDSGPAKCASATNTPALVVWKGHHPAQYHLPSPNTSHLIPQGWEDRPPCRDPLVREFFRENYTYQVYPPGGLVEGVQAWLATIF